MNAGDAIRTPEPAIHLHWRIQCCSTTAHHRSPIIPSPTPGDPEGLQKEATYTKITGIITITKFLIYLDRASCC